ncbi:Uncharacterised protein [Fusobacterium varium]|nr:Uncharacterised protein [Fusobacterium varium]
MKNIKGDILLRKGKSEEKYKGIGKDDINIENLPILADNEGAFGSPTSDSIKAMVTLESAKILTLIYCFSKNENLEEVLEKSFKYLEEYTEAKNIVKFIVE